MLKTNTLYHGNCFKLFPQLESNSIDLLITSPPYNVGWSYDEWDDSLSEHDYHTFMNAWLEEAYRVLKPDGRMALNTLIQTKPKHLQKRIFLLAEYWEHARNIGFQLHSVVELTEKSPHKPKYTAWGSWLSCSAPYIYLPKEYALVLYKDHWKKQTEGKTYFTNSPEHKEEFKKLVVGNWEYFSETRGLTEANFSVDFPLNALKILSYKHDIVLDPFMGSGTTAVACQMLDRQYIGFEISEKYHQISEQRLTNYQGGLFA